MEKRRNTHTRYNPDIYTLDDLPRVRTKDLQPLFRAARHVAELVNGTWTDTTTPTFNDLWTYYTHATLSVGGVEYTITPIHNNSRDDLHIDTLVFTWEVQGNPVNNWFGLCGVPQIWCPRRPMYISQRRMVRCSARCTKNPTESYCRAH